jgi:Tfp pilus assembly protein PilX
MTYLPRTDRGERGFSMFIVIMAMFVTSMFVAAAFAAADGDLPMAGASKDRKETYAAAEAGVNFYLSHLNQDPDYWTKCENVPAPNGTEVNPVNTVWNGSGSDPRRWRNVTGNNGQYTIEILPANGYAKCDPANQASVLDLSTGSFRIRVTGRPTATSSLRRSIITTFRRRGFLDYLWFTYYEDKDPQVLPTQTQRTAAQNACAGLFRAQRQALTGTANSTCAADEIQWITGDQLRGPVRSNDSFLICGTPTFGRSPADTIQIATQPGTPPAASRVADKSCTDGSTILGVWKSNAAPMEPPSSNDDLKTVAQAGTGYYRGKTYIRLDGATMSVKNKNTLTNNVPIPANGVIYVDADSTQGPCNPTQYPDSATYSEDNGCGNVYVSGTYNNNLTIAASNDVIIAPTTDAGTLDWSGLDEKIQNGANAVLGLIANNFVRVGHPVKLNNGSCNGNNSSAMDAKGLIIQAAILSLQHSFIVDNYDCGNPLGKLSVTGAIAQRYRGTVGSGGGATGFIKDYLYDDRLRYRSPPYFLNPIDAAWNIVRTNEQVPACLSTKASDCNVQ